MCITCVPRCLSDARATDRHLMMTWIPEKVHGGRGMLKARDQVKKSCPMCNREWGERNLTRCFQAGSCIQKKEMHLA